MKEVFSGGWEILAHTKVETKSGQNARFFALLPMG
jgi:hypothetical protein